MSSGAALPHDQVPEGLVHWILGAVGTALSVVLGFAAKFTVGRMRRVEQLYDAMNRRVVNLERLYAVHDLRHRENQRRLDGIERRCERIEEKIDRLIERGNPYNG